MSSADLFRQIQAQMAETGGQGGPEPIPPRIRSADEMLEEDEDTDAPIHNRPRTDTPASLLAFTNRIMLEKPVPHDRRGEMARFTQVRKCFSNLLRYNFTHLYCKYTPGEQSCMIMMSIMSVDHRLSELLATTFHHTPAYRVRCLFNFVWFETLTWLHTGYYGA